MNTPINRKRWIEKAKSKYGVSEVIAEMMYEDMTGMLEIILLEAAQRAIQSDKPQPSH